MKSTDRAFDRGRDVGSALMAALVAGPTTVAAALAGEPLWAVVGFVTTMGYLYVARLLYVQHRRETEAVPDEPAPPSPW